MSALSTGPVPGIAKAVGFLLALGAVFLAALGVGYAAGPTPAAQPPVDQHDEDHAEPGGHEDPGLRSAPAPSAATIPGGLMIAQDGYRLRLVSATRPVGQDVPLSFVVEGPDGEPLTSYAVEHEKRLHLIAVRRDFQGFQHVHPEMAPDGTWTTRLDLTAGPWRVFADFRPTGGAPLTLGADLAVAGDFRPAAPGGEDRTFRTDGYTVTLDGALTAGADAELIATVSRDGRPVTDLQPYLGAYGHLVALREGDLAYLHVHPDGHPGDGTTAPGPEVVFYAAVPSDGRYRLFLDFRHEGVVRTAEFTVAAGESPTDGNGAAPEPEQAQEGESHGHD